MCSVEAVVCHAYQRWLKTQGETSPAMERMEPQFGDGWLAMAG
ncbi:MULTISPECIES: hypothetical protein [Gammaproteobacteria]|nr:MULTISPECIES: hypothetical protein [Gammaproteobacteria]